MNENVFYTHPVIPKVSSQLQELQNAINMKTISKNNITCAYERDCQITKDLCVDEKFIPC